MKNIFLLISVLLVFSSLEAKAQEIFPFTCATLQQVSEKDFRNWLEKDVAYLISKPEKKLFLKLKTDEEKIAFIENFWLRRDPDPDTEENEFKTEYCARVKETAKFESEIPGWKTDRGRIYILYGKPEKIERGYSSFKNDTNVLYEKWHYEYISGVGNGIELFFIDLTESNEFRMLKKEEQKFLYVFTKDMDEETLKLLQQM